MQLALSMNDTASLAITPLAPGSLRIAVASTDGIRIDQHFGHADAFHVYDVRADGINPLAPRVIADHAESEDEDPRDTICRMLADCTVMLVAKIGVAPQERMASIGIEATNMYAGKPIAAALADVYAAKAAAARADEPVDATGFRLLHTMLRVSDMERSLDFYTRLLGMRVLATREHKKNQFTQNYLGYSEGHLALELVFNWMRDEPYTQGDAFGHIAIEVRDIIPLCARLAASGVPMPRPPRSQRHGDNIVAFTEDPDGHRIELVEVFAGRDQQASQQVPEPKTEAE